MPSKASRVAHLALATVIALSGAAVSTAVTAPSAHAVSAASSVGGEISRAEVIARAKYWLSKKDDIVYNQEGWYPDQDGRLYRTDCSGYVSMAWHLGTSATTRNLAEYSVEISRDALPPGDALNDYDTHVILFAKWDNADHTRFSCHSFGETPVKYVTGASIDDFPSSDKALRYKKIVDDAPAAHDFTGDGKADIVATNETTGELVLYPSNGTGLNGSGVIGSSFHLMDKLTMADLNKDGTSDIVATSASTGDLKIYASNGSKISDTRTIGNGWSTMSNLF